MRRIAKSLVGTITANRFAQACLMKGARLAEYCMGVGAAGSDVRTSGEMTVLQRVKESGGGSSIVFDVGSNKGQFLRIAHEVLGSAPRQIHCFEPSKAAWTSLCQTAQVMNGVTLCNVGLGQKSARDYSTPTSQALVWRH